jgi:hypothetical protein
VQSETDFVDICRKWSGKRQIYAGLNPRKTKSGKTVDISRVIGIPFDVDTIRPKNTAATNEELTQSKERVNDLITWMQTTQYNQPLISMSGNGFHVVLKVNIPVTDDLSEKLEAFFHEAPTKGLDSIFDLPRIIKVPGTLSIKGVPTAARPHRLSRILTLGNETPDKALREHIINLKQYVPPLATVEPKTTSKKTGKTTQSAELFKVKTSGLKPCFKKFAEEGGKLSKVGSEDHLLRLALVTEAHSKGYGLEEIVDLFRKAEDFEEKQTRYQIEQQLKTIVVEGAKPWTCIAVNKHNGCFGAICKQYARNIVKRRRKKKKTPERKPQEKAVIVSEDIESEVSRIMDSDTPFEIIESHLDNLVAGETENKLTLFILLLSGKSKDPLLKQMILLKGEAGAGKSTLMNIADLFNVKSVGRFTEHALDYTELAGFEVLKLKEIGLMDEEKQGVSTLKFLSADDEGYIVEATVKDSSRRIPPITVISSTTRVSLDSQYTRRNWIISPDESKEQTEKIRSWTANFEREKNKVLLGLKSQTSFSFSKQVLSELVKRITPSDIIIPFPDTLLRIMDTTSLRVRGDYKKIMALVKLYAILRQKNLPELPTANSHVKLLTPKVALKAIKIAQGPLTLMTAELDERTRKTINFLKDLAVMEKGAAIDPTVRQQIMEKSGWSDSTLRSYLNEIEKRGYLRSDGKKPKTWFMVYDMDGIMRRLSRLSSIIENDDYLLIEMGNEAHKWLVSLSSIATEGETDTLRDDLEQRGTLKQRISKILPLFPLVTIDNSVLETNQTPLGKNSKDNRQKHKLTIIQDIQRTFWTERRKRLCAFCNEETEIPWKAHMKNNAEKWICEECHGQYKRLTHTPTELQKTAYHFLNGKGVVAQEIFRDEMKKLGFSVIDVIGELVDDSNIVFEKDSIGLKKDILHSHKIR